MDIQLNLTLGRAEMTIITTYQINEDGLAFIAEELGQRHKKFSNSTPTLEMLLAWAADVESKLEEGNGAEFEIRAWDAVSGHTELVELDVTDHFTAKQLENV